MNNGLLAAALSLLTIFLIGALCGAVFTMTLAEEICVCPTSATARETQQ